MLQNMRVLKYRGIKKDCKKSSKKDRNVHKLKKK